MKEEHKKEIVTINNKQVEIDVECVDIVLWLNEIGLKTKYCCQDNSLEGFYIQFHEDVTDKQVESFVEMFYYGDCFRFYKWCRNIMHPTPHIQHNWTIKEWDYKIAQRKFKELRVQWNNIIGRNN